jgi:hypothetical protein
MTITADAQQLADMARALHRKPLSKANVDAAIKSSSLPTAVANTEPRELLEDNWTGKDSKAARARHAGRRS